MKRKWFYCLILRHWRPVGANLLRLNSNRPLKEGDQLLENLHPMPIDLPSQGVIEAWRMGMNRFPVG